MDSPTVEYVTATIASGVLYDILKYGAQLSVTNLKKAFQGWLIDDVVAEKLEEKLKPLALSESLSKQEIEEKLNNAPGVAELLHSIRRVETSINVNANNNSGTINIAGRDINNR